MRSEEAKTDRDGIGGPIGTTATGPAARREQDGDEFIPRRSRKEAPRPQRASWRRVAETNPLYERRPTAWTGLP
jgi:hypothetical protein